MSTSISLDRDERKALLTCYRRNPDPGLRLRAHLIR
jgi:hypothetical protein